MDDRHEVPLTGGNVAHGVVRVGDTVRRPAGPWSQSVHALLRHLESVGHHGAPRSLGFDERGRHVLEYVDGEVTMPFAPPDPVAAARRAGREIRDLHDALAGFDPPADAVWNVVIEPDAEEQVVHHDLAPWNLVAGRERWVFIDWDNAGPGSRLWDVAYAAHGFVPLQPDTPPDRAEERLAALADGYGLDDAGRTRLVGLLVPRMQSMHDLLERGAQAGDAPWARLWQEGHGDVWAAHARWTERHLSRLRAALLDA